MNRKRAAVFEIGKRIELLKQLSVQHADDKIEAAVAVG